MLTSSRIRFLFFASFDMHFDMCGLRMAGIPWKVGVDRSLEYLRGFIILFDEQVVMQSVLNAICQSNANASSKKRHQQRYSRRPEEVMNILVVLNFILTLD